MTRLKLIALTILALLVVGLPTGIAAAEGYVYNDVHWDPIQFRLSYYINPRLLPDGTKEAPSDFVEIVKECIRQWEAPEASAFSFYFEGEKNRSANNVDGTSNFYWDTLGEEFDPEDPLPVITKVRLNDAGRIVEVDTIFNGTMLWSTTGLPAPDEYDLKTAILRELGRWIQLENITDPAYSDSVMYGETLQPGMTKQELAQVDIDGVCFVYPADHVADDYEANGDNDPAGATVLLMDVPQKDHNIFPDVDVDWFTFTLDEPMSVRIATSGGDTELFLYNSAMTEIGHNDTVDNPPAGMSPYEAVIDAPGLVAGTYYVKVVSSMSGLLPVIDPYSIVLTTMGVDAYERDNTFLDAKRISSGQQQVRSLIASGFDPDVDWVTFVLGEPSNIRIAITLPEGSDSFTFELTLYNDDLSRVGPYEDNWLERANLPTDTYYVKIVEWDDLDVPEYTLSYTRSPALGDLFEVDNTPQEAQAQPKSELVVGTPQDHSIDPGDDDDWVVIKLTQQMYLVTVSTTGPISEGDTTLEMFTSEILTNPNAFSIAYDDDSGTPPGYSQITQSNLPAGDYYVRVRSKTGAVIPLYTISLALTAAPSDAYEPDDTQAAAKTLLPGDANKQTHSIKPLGDADWVTFSLTVSAEVTISATGGTLALRLFYGGNQVGYAVGPDPQIVGRRVAGTYYLKVTEATDSAVVDPYVLSLTQFDHPKDYLEPNDTPADASPISSGVTITNISVSPLGDEDWFAVNVTQLADIDITMTVTEQQVPLPEPEVYLYDNSVLSTNPDLVDELAYGTASIDLPAVSTVEARCEELSPGAYYIRVKDSGNNDLVDKYQITATLTPARAFRALPSQIEFDADWQHPPQPLTITVRHLNATANWTAERDCDWVTLSAYSGSVSPGNPQNITAMPSIMTFEKGTYTCNLTFTAGAVTSIVTVTMHILENPGLVSFHDQAGTPVTQLSFSAGEGGIDPAPQEFIIESVGGGNIIPWTLTSDQPWLELRVKDRPNDPCEGTFYKTSPSAIVVAQPLVLGLLPQTHTANLTLTAFEASPIPQPNPPVVRLTLSPDLVKPEPVDTKFAQTPQGVDGTGTIVMSVVDTSDDQEAPIQFFFEFMGGDTGGLSSGWVPEDPVKHASPFYNYTFTVPRLVEPEPLVPGGYYSYRVKARDTSAAKNETNFSAKASGYVAPAVPPAPTLGAAAYTSVNVTPLRGANSPRVLLAILNSRTGTYVDRYGEPAADPVWRLQDEWGTVTVTGIPGDTLQRFRVIARNGDGQVSAPGPEATLYTLDDGPPLPTPSFSAPPAFSGTTITMSCTEAFDQSTPVQYFFEYTGPEADAASSTWQTTRSHTTPGNMPGGTYSFRVKARDSLGHETPYSDTIAIYRLPAVPPIPTISSVTDSTFWVTMQSGGNSTSVQYAISVTWAVSPSVQTSWLDASGNMISESNKPFNPASINLSTDQITLTNHGYTTDDLVMFSNTGGSLPTGLNSTNLYYVHAVDANIVTIHTSKADAITGENPVDITATGTGTHRIRTIVAAWRTLAEWGTPTAKGFPSSMPISVIVFARNQGGEVSGPSPTGVRNTLGTDTTPPTPNPMQWDPWSPDVRCDVNTGKHTILVRAVKPVDNTWTTSKYPSFEFINVTTNEPPTWKPYNPYSDPATRSFTFPTNTGVQYVLQACTPYKFKVRAKDAASTVHTGSYSEIVEIYTKANPPGTPSIVVDLVNRRANLAINDAPNRPNPPLVRYAVQIANLVNKYVGPNGTIVDTADRAVLPREGWSTVYLTDFDGGMDYQFRAIAINPADLETTPATSPPTPNLIARIEFDAPTPNPATLKATSHDSINDKVSIEANPATDSNPVSYVFESVGNVMPGQTLSTTKYTFTPGVTAISVNWRVKYRDAVGNETAWSSPMALNVDPTVPNEFVMRGSESNNLYISLSPGRNSRTAEYAIGGYRMTMQYEYVGLGGNPQVDPCWQTLDAWGDLIKINNAAANWFSLNTFVRRAGTTAPVKDTGIDTFLGGIVATADTTPPTPSPSSFLEAPHYTSPTAVAMKATLLTDAQTWVMYGFQQQESGQWVWQYSNEYAVSGLTPATTYHYYTRGRDTSQAQNMNVASAYIAVSTPAAVPEAPTVIPGAYDMLVQINPGSNPAVVEYAIYDDQLGTYVDFATKTPYSPTESWATLAQWGSTVTIQGIIPLGVHRYAIKARTGLLGVTPDVNPTVLSPITESRAKDSDGDTPLPNPPVLKGRPVATGTTSLRAEVEPCTDQTGPVQYKFTLQGAGIDSGWQASTLYEPTGLVPGGKYILIVQARDSSVFPQQNYTATTSPFTLYLNPVLPSFTVGTVGSVTVNLNIVASGNSSETLYAIFDARTGRYVNASKALASEVPVWRKASDWGTPLTVSGLVQKSDYFFSIAARSQDFVTTAWSAEQKVTTLENQIPKPDMLTVLGLAPRGLKAQLGGPVYDPATTFLIRCGGTPSGYVQSDGKIGASEVWRTLAQWNNASGIYIHSLAPNSNYTFDIRAQFGGNLSEWSDPKPALTNIEGDCDGSNKVNILDLIFVRAKLNQSVLSGDNYKADADDSGLINILDLIRVRAYLNTHR